MKKEYWHRLKKVKLSILLFSLVCMQSVNAEFVMVSPDEMLADLAIRNAEVTKQEGRHVEVKFNIENNDNFAHLDLIHALELWEITDSGDYLVDTQVDETKFDIHDAELKNFNIAYDAPDSFDGEYLLKLKLSNMKGIPLGRASVSTVTFIKKLEKMKPISLITESCFLEIGNKGYEMNQGIDLGFAEEMKVICQYENTSKESVNAKARYTHFERTSFGEKLPGTQESTAQNLSPTKGNVAFIIEKQAKPQAYYVEAILVDDNGRILSNEINFRYIIQGNSGTVQNISLDENGYKKGDKANVEVMVSNSADQYFGSRAQADGSALVEFFANIEVNNKDGICGELKKQKLSKEKISENFLVLITRDCPKAQVKIDISNEVGEKMDAYSVENNLEEKKVEAVNRVDPPDREPLVLWKILTYLGIALATLFLLIIVKMKKKKKGGSSLTILCLFSILSAMSVGTVDAATFNVGTHYIFPSSGSFNLSARTVLPGARLTLDVGIDHWICTNRQGNSSVKLVTPHSAKIVSKTCPRTSRGSGNHPGAHCNSSGRTVITAPSSPGTYRVCADYAIQSKGSGKVQNNSKRYCESYKVKATNGKCSTVVNQCLSGTFSKKTDSKTQTLWDCIGGRGGATASCGKDLFYDYVCGVETTDGECANGSDTTWNTTEEPMVIDGYVLQPHSRAYMGYKQVGSVLKYGNTKDGACNGLGDFGSTIVDEQSATLRDSEGNIRRTIDLSQSGDLMTEDGGTIFYNGYIRPEICAISQTDFGAPDVEAISENVAADCEDC